MESRGIIQQIQNAPQSCCTDKTFISATEPPMLMTEEKMAAASCGYQQRVLSVRAELRIMAPFTLLAVPSHTLDCATVSQAQNLVLMRIPCFDSIQYIL